MSTRMPQQFDRGRMALDKAQTSWQAGAWDLVLRLGQADGSAGHAWLTHLLGAGTAARDLSDAIHALCAVHGVHPGMVDEAFAARIQPEAAEWLEEIVRGFARERAYLATLTAAVGPAPSTPGQAASEAAMIGERHALQTLTRSTRLGCATGAVAALVHDWREIRRVLDRAADRFGADIAPPSFPPEAETATIVGLLGATVPTERAITFGAQQLFAQHRGLWTLLEARASARES